MYGRFLKEAATITSESRLVAIGKEMRQIGDAWENVAHLFKRSSVDKEPRGGLVEAADVMMDIARQEEQAWKCLHEVSAATMSRIGKGIE